MRSSRKNWFLMMSAASLIFICISRPLCADQSQQIAFFESKIRPVLIKHCYECHSAEADELGGALRVDSAVGLLRGGDSGTAIVKGDPDQSLLIDAIRYDSMEMPPAGKLPEDVIADFEHWVESGAVDPRDIELEAKTSSLPKSIDIEEGRKFWAFQPIQNPKRPAVSNSDWPVTDIDAFVLAGLEQSGLTSAPDTDRRTLVRRLYFDLIGLPPSPEEMQHVLSDEREDAISRLIDRLLASPQFGVHWGRHWLDVARYADSNGGDFNATFHNAWKYRDYVIAAFNNDKPYDQFVREQVAGDLLDADSDEERSSQIIATGFLMIGAKMLSERDKTKLTMDVVDEQLNTVGQAFLGMTLGCARCHDHKFDPIPTRDYYALAGIFRSTRTLKGESQEYVSTWPRRVLPASPERIAEVERYQADRKQLAGSITNQKKQRDQLKRQVADLNSASNRLVIDDSQAKLIGDWKPSTYSTTFFGAGYIHDDQSEKGKKYVEFPVTVPRDADYDVQVSYSSSDNRATNVPISVKHASADVEVFVDQRKKPPIEGMYVSIGKFPFAADKAGVVTFSTGATDGYVIVDSVRLIELDQDGKPVPLPAGEETGDNILAKQLKEVESGLQESESTLKELEKTAPAPLEESIAVAEDEQIGDCEICIRGEHENLGEVVPRGMLQVIATGSPLPTISKSASGRRELADWMTDPNHPLTARVYVNRVWQHLLGRGIVASVDNFGNLGDRPTHPQLLDRLATDFMRNQWSTKRLIREIVASRVYRMSSRHDEASWTTDPDNTLLWRAHRKQIPAESIRDSILAISGKLDFNPSGTPVEGLGTLVTQNTSEEKAFERNASLHRSAFLPIIRSELPAILLAFDFADPDLVTGRRAVTNVPAQALLLLNSPFVMEQADLAATRIRESFSEEPTEAQLIRKSYELVLSRPPADTEISRASSFLAAIQESKENTAGKPAGTDPLGRLIHTLIASTEFRMLN